MQQYGRKSEVASGPDGGSYPKHIVQYVDGRGQSRWPHLTNRIKLAHVEHAGVQGMGTERL